MSKNPKKFTDEVLIQMICGQNVDRDRALHYIFVDSGWQEEAMHYLQHKGVHLQNAKDAFQEALIALDQHIRSGSFDKKKSLKPYFMGICEGRAFSNKRSQQRIDNQAEMPIVVTSETPETETLKTEKRDIIRRLLLQLDDKCRILLNHYMLSFSMKEIREMMHISSDAMTRKMAFECRQKLGALIDENPTLKRYLQN